MDAVGCDIIKLNTKGVLCMDFKGRIVETENILKRAGKADINFIVVSSMIGTEKMSDAEVQKFLNHFNGNGFWAIIESKMNKLPGVFFRISTTRVK